MALSIGVTPGCRVRVGDTLLQVLETVYGVVTITLNGGKPILVTEDERVEILPEVFVSVGVGAAGEGNGNRLAFEAPRSIRINRVPA